MRPFGAWICPGSRPLSCSATRSRQEVTPFSDTPKNDRFSGRLGPAVTRLGHIGPTHRNDTVGATSENVLLDRQPIGQVTPRQARTPLHGAVAERPPCRRACGLKAEEASRGPTWRQKPKRGPTAAPRRLTRPDSAVVRAALAGDRPQPSLIVPLTPDTKDRFRLRESRDIFRPGTGRRNEPVPAL